MKKVMLILISFLFLFTSIAFADDLAFNIPCSTSGVIQVSGTWDTDEGTVHFELLSVDCVQNDTAISGTGTIDGVFKIGTIPTSATVNLETLFDAVLTQDSSSVTGKFSKTASGEYNLITQKLDGIVDSSWNISGEIDMSVLELLAIDWSTL